MLTFALPTGRSLEDCIEILEGSGLPVDKLKNHGRNLDFSIEVFCEKPKAKNTPPYGQNVPPIFESSTGFEY